MFNFGFVQKILEIAGESPKTIEDMMVNLAELIEVKFRSLLMIHLGKNSSDEKLEEFMKEFGNVEQVDQSVIDKFQKWSEGTKVDFDKFMEELDLEMSRLEVSIVQAVKDQLDPSKKTQLLDYLQSQIEETRTNEEELLKAIAEMSLEQLSASSSISTPPSVQKAQSSDQTQVPAYIPQ